LMGVGVGVGVGVDGWGWEADRTEGCISSAVSQSVFRTRTCFSLLGKSFTLTWFAFVSFEKDVQFALINL
jgi:hypothetical protein